MPHVNAVGRHAAALVLGLAAALPLQAQAQDAPLKWTASVYLWLPSVGGSTAFPPSTGGSIDVSMQDVLDALKMTFMGNIGVKKGKWGFWTDLAYADLGDSKQGFRQFSIAGNPLPGGVDANVNLDLKMLMWTAVGTYTVVDTPENSIDLLAGTRLLDLKQTLGWSLNGNIGSLPIDRTGNSVVTTDNWDAIIGVKGYSFLDAGRKWFIPYYLDIGTGQSKFTWQGNVGVGYRFGWGNLVASYRYVDYDMKSGHPVQSAYFGGPLVGASFQW